VARRKKRYDEAPAALVLEAMAFGVDSSGRTGWAAESLAHLYIRACAVLTLADLCSEVFEVRGVLESAADSHIGPAGSDPPHRNGK